MDSLQDRVEDVVIETPNFRLSLEPYNGIHFVHQRVYVWNKQTLKETQMYLDTLGKLYNLRVFAHPSNTKLYKYAKLFGFSYEKTQVAPLTGISYHILRRGRYGRTI